MDKKMRRIAVLLVSLAFVADVVAREPIKSLPPPKQPSEVKVIRARDLGVER